MKFQFKIGDNVSIKGSKYNYTIIDIKKDKYILQDNDGFIVNKQFLNKELINTHKEEHIKKIHIEKKIEKQKIETLHNILKKFIEWNPKKRPILNLFIISQHSPFKIFEWKEEDYQGSIFCIYKMNYLNSVYYICVKGGFGSCSACDMFRHCNENNLSLDNYIKKTFDDIKIITKLKDIYKQYPWLHSDCKIKIRELINQMNP